jgi:hypothetical protein
VAASKTLSPLVRIHQRLGIMRPGCPKQRVWAAFQTRRGLETYFGTNVHFVTYPVALNGKAIVNHEFKNEVFSGFEPNPLPACSHCGEKPKLLRKMLNPQNGRTTRMFKCDCGEQTWSEDKG